MPLPPDTLLRANLPDCVLDAASMASLYDAEQWVANASFLAGVLVGFVVWPWVFRFFEWAGRRGRVALILRARARRAL